VCIYRKDWQRRFARSAPHTIHCAVSLRLCRGLTQRNLQLRLNRRRQQCCSIGVGSSRHTPTPILLPRNTLPQLVLGGRALHNRRRQSRRRAAVCTARARSAGRWFAVQPGCAAWVSVARNWSRCRTRGLSNRQPAGGVVDAAISRCDD